MNESQAVRENYDLGVLAGSARREQEIIKLLEDSQSEKCKDYDCFSNLFGNTHDWECGVDTMNYLIALIKGEK